MRIPALSGKVRCRKLLGDLYLAAGITGEEIEVTGDLTSGSLVYVWAEDENTLPDDEVPQTGLDDNALVWLGIVAAAGLGIVALFALRRRRNVL